MRKYAFILSAVLFSASVAFAGAGTPTSTPLSLTATPTPMGKSNAPVCLQPAGCKGPAQVGVLFENAMPSGAVKVGTASGSIYTPYTKTVLVNGTVDAPVQSLVDHHQLSDVRTVIAVLAFTTSGGGAATKMLLDVTTDYTVSSGKVIAVGDHSDQTWLVVYLAQ